MIASTDDFASHVMAHAGGTADCAERAALAVLTGLGGQLSAAHRRFVADELPPALAAALLASDNLAVPIEEHVLVPGMTVGQARELIASVCRVLAEELSTQAIHVICSDVPSLATYFVKPVPYERHVRARPDSLAAGHPGSQRPISEAGSFAAQSESVIAENPHAATKLSSSAGATQERHHRTLAEGNSDHKRSIARTRT